jgi:hypothetical protein
MLYGMPLMRNHLWLQRPVHASAAFCHQLVPSFHLGLRAFQKTAVRLGSDDRQQGAQHIPTLADEPYVHRVAKADPRRVDVDLDRFRFIHRYSAYASAMVHVFPAVVD